MKKGIDKTDEYYVFIITKLLVLAPIIALSAAVVFTGGYFGGLFSYVSPVALIFFDAVCCSYFFIAGKLRKKNIVQNGTIDSKEVEKIGIKIALVIILQWNLISYIFPSEAFWGFAPMFVLLTAFLFNTRVVLVEIIGLSLSMVFSWQIAGDALLPVRDEQFAENVILRMVALVVSFTVIYILTLFAESFIKTAKENYQAMNEQNEALEIMGRDIIDFTADIIEERDATSGSHVKRLKKYSGILARQIAELYPEYGLTEDAIEDISMACVLHDVGKIGISDSILQKPGKLTPEEFEIIKTHTDIGASIIDKLPESVDEGYKKLCREICQYHHEKYDGKGYPSGLVGDDIPISAQIVSVVDCYDALTSERPYKHAIPGEKAITMIINGECGAFSEKMKNCLLECKERFIAE